MTIGTAPSLPAVTVKYPGIPITTNGNQLVSQYVEARVADAGIFYPITPSTEMGEAYQASVARGERTVFGESKIAIEAEGEHAAQGGAIACSVTGRRVVNFTSGQGVVYGIEQYFHAPGKLSTMVLEVAARALTKHALNVHCGHDDVNAALDTGWTILFAKNAQQAADQALILRRVNELALTPGMNVQDGFLTSHLERTFLKPEAGLIREFLGRADDEIPCPTEAQRRLFGPTRRRIPRGYDLRHPALLGSVQNQEHYMQGVAARRHHFVEPILGLLEESYEHFARLTGRHYGLVSYVGDPEAETVFVVLGSAAENIEAGLPYILATRNERVGVLHINVLRPFPEAAVARLLAGRETVIVLERTDDAMAADGPLARDLRTVLSKAAENHLAPCHHHLPAIAPSAMPRLFSGVYGLGSRDFRPEGFLGALDFARGRRARQDGRRKDDGTSFFYVGIDHPYAVGAPDTPSLLPEGAIAVRFHSVGGWGMITTGKNLGEILGGLGVYVARRDHPNDPTPHLHLSANPKYGSEKKGAPTNYFLVCADAPIKVNCDLHHVDVVLCCDPRVFTHTNPLSGLRKGGAFVWECEAGDDATVWTRIPARLRAEILEKELRLFVLDGFRIARETTPRADLQYRMQGNAFLGAFFRVSSFLQDHRIPAEEFRSAVKAQYEKKFGRLGAAVVTSNLAVMERGFSEVREIRPGAVDAEDKSSLRGPVHCPLDPAGAGACGIGPDTELDLPPLFSRASYDAEFRSGLGYFTPSSPRAATGIMAAATGATNSKYGARRQVPIWHADRCTQCMACIVSCPDTALPNTAQDLSTWLSAVIRDYVPEGRARTALVAALPAVEAQLRVRMREETAKAAKDAVPTAFSALALGEFRAVLASEVPTGEREKAEAALATILPKLPAAYAKTPMIFGTPERKTPGSGGIFSIFVSDLCKGCGECVEQCGDHDALEMVEETEDLNADHVTATMFLKTLPDTPKKYLGSLDPDHLIDAKTAALHYHLMVQSNYQALVSGDGACAGCGEKSALRALATITEAYLRPIFHAKADRLRGLAEALSTGGAERMARLREANPEGHARLRKLLGEVLLGLGGENEVDSALRQKTDLPASDAPLLTALEVRLRDEAYDHRELRAYEGGLWNGMAVMGMAASTGCNTVFGSTHPANPHPYPWMNSLFQDGSTVGWLLAESFIADHGRRSVVPERLARFLLDERGPSERDVFDLSHFGELHMTEQEIQELPRVWAIGGDGGFGDIGFQNVSKAVLQNRPNLKVMLLDTQVYSNTGGQNSDSSPMPGGFDMNQIGAATEGKLTEKKSVAEAFLGGHGSPFIAQVSFANAGTLYRSIVDALAYRGTAFLQCYTTCQPEHGVGDEMSTKQAQLARDSRGMPEFVFDPRKGEELPACLSLKGNPHADRDWTWISPKGGTPYAYTVAHWAATEARFRAHFRPLGDADTKSLPALEDVLVRITQDDVVHRRFLDPTHRSFVSRDGAWTRVQGPDGRFATLGVSRQLVLWCVERRKAWRLLQSRAGIRNVDREAQKKLLADFDAGRIPKEEFLGATHALQERLRTTA